jgi:hypothetical protein
MESVLDKWQHLYFDIAIQETDRLHEKLAKYKKKCGPKHFHKSRTSNQLVHERRMLEYACRDGIEHIDPKDLSAEFRDLELLEIAIKRLWPGNWVIETLDD